MFVDLWLLIYKKKENEKRKRKEKEEEEEEFSILCMSSVVVYFTTFESIVVNRTHRPYIPYHVCV